MRMYLRYRWNLGMVAWALHRITGVGIMTFLPLHIFTIQKLHLGPEGFNKAMMVYSAPLYKLGEVGLLAAVLYHSLNGVRLLLVDFAGASPRHKCLFWGLMVTGTGIFLVSAYSILSKVQF